MIKLIDILNEAVGVPAGIENSARNIYNDIVQAAINKDFNKINNEEYSLTLYGDYEFFGIPINTINFDIKFYIVPVDKSKMISMSVSNPAQVKNLKLVFIRRDEIDIALLIGIKNKPKYDDILSFLQQNKTMLVSSIAHELKHVLDKIKKPSHNIHTSSKYRAYQDLTTGIRPVDLFFHYLYYTHNEESLVRPSELKTQMDDLGVTKDNFLEFFKNTETYNNLKEIQNWSYEGFKQELLKEVPQIKKFMKANSIPYSEQDTNEQIVDNLLKVIYIAITEHTSNIVQNMFANTSELNIKKQEKIMQYYKKDIKYINRIGDFFKAQEKMFHNEASRMIKKLSKLVSFVNEQSIHDWELWSKINPNKPFKSI